MKKINTKILIAIEIICLITISITIIFYDSKCNFIDGVTKFPSKYDTYILDGEWEFYENRYLGSNNDELDNKAIVQIGKKLVNNQGSYRIVLTDYNDSGFYLSFSRIYGNTKVFVNRKFIANSQTILFDDIYIDDFPKNDNNEVEIILEITKAEDGMAHFGFPPVLGYKDAYEIKRAISLISIVFILSGLIIVTIITLINRVLFENKTINTIIILLCISCFFQLFFTDNLIFTFFNKYLQMLINIKIISRIIFLTFTYILIYLLFKNFVKARNENLSKHKFPSIFEICLILFCLFIFTAVFIFNSVQLLRIEYIMYVFEILVICFTTIYSYYLYPKNRLRPFVLSSCLIFTISTILDVLINLKIIRSNYYHIMPIITLLVLLLYINVSTILNNDKLSQTKEILNLKEKIRDTEFAFLNSQIQSHFIYNTLNSIQALCNTNPNKAATLIEDFSSYLRTRLEFNKMPVLIDVMDELENIKTYLSIEKERFGNRINYSFQLNAADFLIPPLSIQPLVENSVKHGISKKKNGGTVIIKTYEDEDNIYIEVSDNGVGFNPDSLSEKQRVGTQNIRDRLFLHCKGSLSIQSQEGVGTKSLITIPKEKKA